MKKVLIAEDNPGDQELIRLTFEAIGDDFEVTCVSDGEEMMEFLEEINPYDLSFVLLDLNMPKMSGGDVLLEITRSSDFSTVPVIVFSSSMHPDDVTRSYMQGANAYVRKPSDFADYRKTIQAITEFWGTVNVLARPVEASF